jgi:hypothetical protein
MVIGIMSGVLGVPVEALAIVVAIHCAVPGVTVMETAQASVRQSRRFFQAMHPDMLSGAAD